MPAAKYNLEIEQGATFRRIITWRDSDGALINLTGYQILFQVRRTLVSEDTLIDFDSSALATGQTIGPLNATGIIDITLSATLTGDLDFDNAKWDLVTVSPGSVRDRILEGVVNLDKAVTR